MADSRHSTRRAFLKSAPLAATIIAAPAAAVELAETARERVDRLARELSRALADFNDGEWHAEIFPANKPYGGMKLVWTDFQEPAEVKARRLIKNLQHEMSKLPPMETVGGPAHEIVLGHKSYLRIGKPRDGSCVVVGFVPATEV